MASPKLRVGLVGLGTWARSGHLPVYLGTRLQSVLDVVALCSRSKDKAGQWCQKYGIAQSYDDFSEMLNKADLDVAVICTPDSIHTEYVLQSLDAGCHVLVEKPLATSTEECKSIIEKTQETDREVIVLYHKRSDPLWAEARRRVLAGHYGPLQMGWGIIENPLTVPAGSYFSSNMADFTDVNWFLGTHFYDLIRYMTGINPLEVTARMYYGKLKSLGYAVADSVKADVLFENKASVSFFFSWNLPEIAPTLTKQCVTMHFENGELELDGTRRGFYSLGDEEYGYLNPYFMRETPAGLCGYGANFLEEVMYHLHDSAYVPSIEFPTLEDAWWASSMAEATDQSAKTGHTVPVAPPPKGSGCIG